MKRKIAFLLAFAMLLSVLPMNVFATGQAVPVIDRRTDAYGRWNVPGGDIVDWQISIDVAQLRGQTAGDRYTHLVLPITLEGAHDGYLRFVNYTPEEGPFTRLPIHNRHLDATPNAASPTRSTLVAYQNYPQNRIDMREQDPNRIRDRAAANWATREWNGVGIPGLGGSARLRTDGSTDFGRNFRVEFLRTGNQSGFLLLRYFHEDNTCPSGCCGLMEVGLCQVVGSTCNSELRAMRIPAIPPRLAAPVTGPGPAQPDPTPEPFSYVIHAYPAALIPDAGIRLPHGTQILAGSRIPATATELAAAGLLSGTDFVFEDAGMVRFLRTTQIRGNAIVVTQNGYGALGAQFMGTFTIPRFRHPYDNNTATWTFPAAAGPISVSSNGAREWRLCYHGFPVLPSAQRVLQRNLFRDVPTNAQGQPVPAAGDRFLELANVNNREPNRVSGNLLVGPEVAPSVGFLQPTFPIPRGYHTGTPDVDTTVGFGNGYYLWGTRPAINQDILVTTTTALMAPPLTRPEEPAPPEVDFRTIPLNAAGQLRITLPPIRVQHTDSRVRVNMHTTGGQVLVDRPLANFADADIIITPGSVVHFEHVAALSHLTIREGTAGAFNRLASRSHDQAGTGYIAIRLLAPPNYFWGTPATEHRGHGAINANPGPAPRLHQPVPSLLMGRNNEVYRTVFPHPNGRHELVVIVPITGRPNTAVAAVPATIQLQGLRLMPGENAPREHNVNIDVSVGRVELGATHGAVTAPTWTGLPETIRLEHFGANYANRLFWPQSDGPAGARYIHRANGLHVATRSQAELTLQTYGAEVYFRSGVEGNWSVDRQQYDGHQPRGRVTGASGDYRVTQRLQLIENVPNALGLGPGAPVTFSFPEGVEVLGVHYRFMWDHNNSTMIPWRSQWRHDEAGNAYWNSELAIASNVVTFRNIIDPIPVGSNDRRRLEVEFSLSVAPGFFADHADQVIVTAGGAGVANLPAGARNLAIANVYDPIHVELLGGPLTFEAGETGRVHNLPGRVPIGDLLIAETAGGMLATGETLIIYASGSFMPRVEDLAFHSGVAHTDGTSGLRLSTPREVMVNVHGRLIRGVEFEVIGESSPDDDGGYITLSGNWIAGFVYPEEEYYIVVTGSAVGGTTVLMASYRADDAPDYSRRSRAAQDGRSPGMFNIRPYGVRFIEFVEGGITGLPGGPGHIARPLPQEIRILTTDPFATSCGLHVINPPVIFREFNAVNPALSGGPTTSVGFVSLRVFADIAGADILEDYPGPGEVTIRGLHSDQYRTVTVTVRTNNRFIGVYVSGGTHRAWDIAEFSGHLTNVPYGQVATINYQQRLYLPFRAVANAFGYDLRVEGPVVIFG